MTNQNSQLNSEVAMANHSGTIKQGSLIKKMMSECKNLSITKLRAASGSLEILSNYSYLAKYHVCALIMKKIKVDIELINL